MFVKSHQNKGQKNQIRQVLNSMAQDNKKYLKSELQISE